MEPDSDNDHNGEPPSKKRKYGEITQGSGKAGGGKSAVGSKSANADQNDLDELLSA